MQPDHEAAVGQPLRERRGDESPPPEALCLCAQDGIQVVHQGCGKRRCVASTKDAIAGLFDCTLESPRVVKLNAEMNSGQCVDLPPRAAKAEQPVRVFFKFVLRLCPKELQDLATHLEFKPLHLQPLKGSAVPVSGPGGHSDGSRGGRED